MAFPVDIPTRTVTLGGAAALESGAPLILAVTVRASRSLIWNAPARSSGLTTPAATTRGRMKLTP